MKCQIGEAIEKIDKLISHGSKVDDNIRNQLIKVKKKLNSVKDIRMSRMQSNNTGSESKTPEFDKKGFNGYVLIKDTGGKGSAEGDAKDKAMREVANGFIGEFAYRAGVNTPASSTFTSVKTIANKDKSSPSAFGNSNTISYIPKNTANNIDGFTYNSGYYYSKEHIKKTYKITGSSYGKKEDNSNTVPKILAKELVKFMQSIQSDSDVSDIIDYLGENKNNEKNAVDTRGHKLYKYVIELLPKLAKAVRKGQAGGEKYNSISMKDDIDNLFVLLDLGKDLVKKIIEDTPFKLIEDNSYEKDYYSIGARYIDGLTAGSDVLSVKTVMLAKNSNNRFKESYPEDSYKKFAETLREFTKELIDEAHNSGATFVVGDMPGVDTQFIEYLNEIGASYKVYTTNEAGKEFDRKGIDGSKYRNIVETKSQVENRSVEPEVKYGSVVKYKPENGIEGYYVVRGFSSNGGLQLTDSEGKNFSGTPSVNKVKFVKQLEIKTYNKVDYIIDSNNMAYTKNGKVADSYVNQIIGKNKTETKENDTNAKENKDISNLDKKISEIFSDKLYSDIVSDFDKGDKESAVEKIIRTYSHIETDTDENIDLKMKVNDRVRIVKGMSSALNDYNRLSRKMIDDLFNKNAERNYEIQPGIIASEGQKNLIDTGIKFLEDKKNADNIGENIMIVQGRGGTGKTSSISRVLINYINENNFTRKPSIFMMTLSHQAKDVLNGMSKQISKETGIIPTTEVIAGAMAWYANGDPTTPGSKIEQRTVSFNDKKISYENKDAKRESKTSSSVYNASKGDIIIVDEASMLDSHELGYLLEKTKQGVKVILIGDYHQAKIVSPNSNNLIGFGEKSEYSKVFDNFTGSKDPLLKKATITELTEIHRQKEGSNILDFADYYADVIDNRIGNKKDKPMMPKANEKEVSYINRDNIVSEIVKDINNGKDTVYIAHTNRDVTITNNEIRNVVSKDPESEYSVGDRMIAYANYSIQGEPPIITNSERLIVSKIENATNKEVSNEKIKQSNGNRVYEFKYRIEDASGKKIQYKKLTLQRKSYSDDSFNVTVIVPDGLLRKVIKSFENKATGSFDTIYKDLLSSYIYADGYKYGPNKDTINFFSAGSVLSYGYAITAHKSQGSTVDIVYTTLPSDPNLAYVAITRAREKVNIVGKEDSQAYNQQSEPDVIDNNKYKTISKDDIEAAKEYMSNKAPDNGIEIDKKRYKNMSIPELKSELENERYPKDIMNNLFDELSVLNEKDNQSDEEFNRILEIESILELGLYNEITEYISSEIKKRENESKDNAKNIKKNINKIYDNIENVIENVGKVDVEIINDIDKIIELLNKYNKNINTGGFYINATASITVFDYKNLDKDDIKYINSKLKNKISSNYFDEFINDFIESRSSDNFIKQNIVHEKIHFATVDFMNKNPDNKYVKDISRIFEIAKSSSVMKKIKNDYWSTDEKEFIAEALSNPDVINGLMSIKSNNTNLLNKLVVAICRILGIEPESNLYNDMLEIFENIANDETNKLSSFKINIEFSKKIIDYDKILGLDKKRYKTISEEDIMQAKDIMSNNKKECE